MPKIIQKGPKITFFWSFPKIAWLWVQGIPYQESDLRSQQSYLSDSWEGLSLLGLEQQEEEVEEVARQPPLAKENMLAGQMKGVGGRMMTMHTALS